MPVRFILAFAILQLEVIKAALDALIAAHPKLRITAQPPSRARPSPDSSSSFVDFDDSDSDDDGETKAKRKQEREIALKVDMATDAAQSIRLKAPSASAEEDEKQLATAVEKIGTILHLLLTQGDKPEHRCLSAKQVRFVIGLFVSVASLRRFKLLSQLDDHLKGVEGWHLLLMSCVGFKSTYDERNLLVIEQEDIQVHVILAIGVHLMLHLQPVVVQAALDALIAAHPKLKLKEKLGIAAPPASASC